MSRHHHGKSLRRDLVSLVLAFFLALSLLTAGVACALRVGVLSEAGLRSVVGRDYCEAVLGEATDEATYYTQPTGIDPAVVYGVFTLDEVRADVDSYITAQFGGLPYSPTFEGPRARLTAKAERAVGDARTTETRDEIVAAYVDDIMGLYQSCIEIPGMDALMEIRANLTHRLPVVVALSLGLAGLLVVSIRRLHHHPHRALRFVAYACGGAALMSTLAPLALYASGFYRGLSVTPESFYLLCTALIDRVLLSCIVAGVVWAFAMLTVILLVSQLRKTAIKPHRSKRREVQNASPLTPNQSREPFMTGM